MGRAGGASALPIHYRVVVGVEPGSVQGGLTHLRLELLFVDGDSKARIGQQRAESFFDRRQRFCEKVFVVVIAPLLDEEVRNRRGNLVAGGQGTGPLRVVRSEG